MKWPEYPAYAHSGIEWLGEIPAHWEVTRLKFVAEIRTGTAKGRDFGERATVELPYLRVANVQDGYLDLSDVATIKIGGDEVERYSLNPGDVLMNEGGDFDKLGRGYVWSAEISPCVHQNHVFAVRPKPGINPYWLNAITLTSYAKHYFILRSKQSTNLASISSTNLKELPVLMPHREEYQVILDFLDRQTAQLDALITKKQRLIELLQEKRTALISHTVTKGLDPSVPMKDSGIEWLGEIPAHWEVVRLGYIARVLNGSTPGRNRADYWTDGTVPWLSSGKVNDDVITEPSEWITEKALRECALEVIPADSVVLGIVGQGRTRGTAAFMGIDSTINQNMAAITPRAGLQGRFLHYVMQQMYDPIREQGRGANQAALNCELVADLRILVPPVDEQRGIAAYLDRETAKIDALITKVQEAIDRLNEYRTALISAAVTGKIDVREAV